MVSVLGAGSERATGFAVASGEVVTVAHAIPPDDAVRVQVGPGTPRRARVLRMDVRADLALLAVPRLRGSVVETATTGDGNQVRVVAARGRRVVTMAASVRRPIDARVSAPGAERALRRPALELEARTRAGDSGAPVVSEGGEVVGVLFARSRNEADTAYALDARALVELLANAGG
ncbi:MAG: S1 family peptidase [Thermoleophilaceae bacterium]